MKKLHISFGILTGVLTLAAIVIAFILFGRTVDDPSTSFPAWTAFAFVGIYYGIGLAVLCIVWLGIWLILRHRTCKK